MDCLCVAFDSRPAWLPETWSLSQLPIGRMTVAEHLAQGIAGSCRRIAIVAEASALPVIREAEVGDCLIEWLDVSRLDRFLAAHAQADLALVDLARWPLNGPRMVRRMLLTNCGTGRVNVMTDAVEGDHSPADLTIDPSQLLAAVRRGPVAFRCDGSDAPAAAIFVPAACRAAMQPAAASRFACCGPALATAIEGAGIPTRTVLINGVDGYLAANRAHLPHLLREAPDAAGYLVLAGKVLIHSTALVAPNCRITGPAVIGPRCLVENDTVLGGTILLQADVRVGRGSLLIDAVALMGTRLGTSSMHQREVLYPGRRNVSSLPPAPPGRWRPSIRRASVEDRPGRPAGRSPHRLIRSCSRACRWLFDVCGNLAGVAVLLVALPLLGAAMRAGSRPRIPRAADGPG